jgi:hypothetical protein
MPELVITVTGNQTNRNFNRPDLATPYTVTFSYTGPSQPDLTTSRITLWDTATGSPTYGQNFYESEIISAPASRQVPRGIYYIDVVSGYPLSSGLFQNFYMYFYAPVDATHTTSRTLTFPTLWELDGDFTGAAALNAVDVYAEQVPTTGLDVAGAYVQTQGISYLLAMPRGALTLSVGLATAYVETMAERLLTYTMPAAHTRKDINLPALPDFRTITGTVVGPNGQPVSGATVAADSAPQTITSTGIYAYHARTTTDTDGTYTMHLPNGTYTVNVTP